MPLNSDLMIEFIVINPLPSDRVVVGSSTVRERR